MRAFGPAVAAATISLALPAVSAGQGPYNAFAGACAMTGVSTYEKPLTGRPQDNVVHTFATGECHGRINGSTEHRSYSVESGVDGSFRGSCYESASTQPMPGYVRFTMGTPAQIDDVVIRFTLTFRTDPVDEMVYTVRGETSGEMRGQARFNTLESTPSAVVACESGGLSESRFEASSYTPSAALVGPAPAAPSPAPGAFAPSVRVLSRSLAAVARRGLSLRCAGTGPATWRLAVTVSRRAARRLGLRRRTLARAVIEIAEGSSARTQRLRLSASARRALRGARTLRVRLTGSVSSGGSEHVVRDTARLRR